MKSNIYPESAENRVDFEKCAEKPEGYRRVFQSGIDFASCFLQPEIGKKGGSGTLIGQKS